VKYFCRRIVLAAWPPLAAGLVESAGAHNVTGVFLSRLLWLTVLAILFD
jgi:hypothetical protein